MSAGAHRRGQFLEHLVTDLARSSEQVFLAEEIARRDGLLQKIDPRVKLAGLLALIFAATWVTRLPVLALLFLFTISLAAVCDLPLSVLVKRVWFGVLLFTGPIALPAIFLTPGEAMHRIPSLGWDITRQGLTTSGLLLLRVVTTSSLAFILVLTTPWMHLLKALRSLKAPVVVVVLLSMTVRYIVLLLNTAQQMFESHRSRTVGVLDAASTRRLVYNTAGVLLGKTMQLSDEVTLAMRARGFRGEVYLLDEFQLTAADIRALAMFIITAAAFAWFGR